MTCSDSIPASVVTAVREGRVYAINTYGLKEVLDGVVMTARIVKRVDIPVHLSDAAGRQATLEGY